ncbi:MAG TPA: glycosyltransferase family 39 protein [Bryobacterales bacterium]|nr:glycosyltransferase family 39 protein [Bryobacterales bacterium]
MSFFRDSLEAGPGAAGAARPNWTRRRLALLFWAFAGAILAFDLILLEQIPYAATVDDGAYAAAAFSFVHTGRAGLPMDKGLFDLDRDLIMYGRIPAALVGLCELALGPNCFASRLPGLLAVWFSVPLVLLIARECRVPELLAATGSLLWLLSVPAQMLAHTARPDPLLMLFTVVCCLLLLRALRNDDWRLFLLAGFIAGLSLEVHMIGAALIAALAAAVLTSEPAGRIRNSALVCLGAAPAAFLWLYDHAWSQPDLWRIQWVGFWQAAGPSPLLLGPKAIITSAVARYRSYFWDARYHRYALEGFFLAAGVCAGLMRRNPVRRLAAIVVLFHVFLAILSALPHAGYMAAVYPLGSILIASAFFGSSRRVVFLAGLSLIAFYCAQMGYWAAHRDVPLPGRVRADVLRHAGDKPFLAADNLWFYFPRDRNLRSVVSANFVQRWAPDLPWEQAFRRYLNRQQVQFVVVDKVFREFLLPSQWAFLARNMTPLAEYNYGKAGSIQIYSLHLPGKP